MAQAPLHPQLRLRPVRNPYLRRPSREDEILGKLEYINFDWGWWQGTTMIDGVRARLDIETSSPNVAAEDWRSAGQFLDWIQSKSSMLRQHVAEELTAGNAWGDTAANAGLVKSEKMSPPSYLPDLNLLQPFIVVIYPNSFAQIRYHCDLLPVGGLFGYSKVVLDVKESGGQIIPNEVWLNHEDIDRRRQRILEETPTPVAATGFVHSLPDQFLASAGRSFEWDSRLRNLLDQAIREVESAISTGTGELVSYLRSIRMLLIEIKRDSGAIPHQK